MDTYVVVVNGLLRVKHMTTQKNLNRLRMTEFTARVSIIAFYPQGVSLVDAESAALWFIRYQEMFVPRGKRQVVA
jgi:hypothetical protein